jgi:hypothetical protein
MYCTVSIMVSSVAALAYTTLAILDPDPVVRVDCLTVGTGTRWDRCAPGGGTHFMIDQKRDVMCGVSIHLFASARRWQRGCQDLSVTPLCA